MGKREPHISFYKITHNITPKYLERSEIQSNYQGNFKRLASGSRASIASPCYGDHLSAEANSYTLYPKFTDFGSMPSSKARLSFTPFDNKSESDPDTSHAESPEDTDSEAEANNIRDRATTSKALSYTNTTRRNDAIYSQDTRRPNLYRKELDLSTVKFFEIDTNDNIARYIDDRDMMWLCEEINRRDTRLALDDEWFQIGERYYRRSRDEEYAQRARYFVDRKAQRQCWTVVWGICIAVVVGLTVLNIRLH